jgi:hypothetical protein
MICAIPERVHRTLRQADGGLGVADGVQAGVGLGNAHRLGM